MFGVLNQMFGVLNQMFGVNKRGFRLKDKDTSFQELCAEMIQLITFNMLKFTHSESQSLKVIKVAIERAFNAYKKIKD